MSFALQTQLPISGQQLGVHVCREHVHHSRAILFAILFEALNLEIWHQRVQLTNCIRKLSIQCTEMKYLSLQHKTSRSPAGIGTSVEFLPKDRTQSPLHGTEANVQIQLH